MKRAALVLLLLFLAACGIATFDDGDPLSPTATPDHVAAVLGARQVNVGHGVIECVQVRFADGYIESLPAGCALVAPTPPPSATPQPTATNTPVPTLTPPPTNTPRPTATSTPQATEVFPTPTPEATLLPTIPATSIPKPTATPDLGRCVLTVTAGTLNVRATPGGAILGQVHQGDMLAGEGAQTVNGALWYRIWWDTGDVVGYVHSAYVSVAGDCSFGAAAWLIHVVPGFNVMELYSTYPLLKNAGLDYGIKTYAGAERCEETLLYGGICIYRYPMFGSDCPVMGAKLENDPVASAKAWMAEYERHLGGLLQYRHNPRFIVELDNECFFGSESNPGAVYWWAAFLNTAADIAIARDWPRVIPFTYGPGDGDSVFTYTVWRDALNKFASRNALAGWHAYTPYHDNGLCACAQDDYLACRHRRNAAALKTAGVNMGYALTEVARSWGSSSVDEADFICFWKQVKNDPGLHSIALWTGGFQGDPRWGVASLEGHYVSLANKVVALQ